MTVRDVTGDLFRVPAQALGHGVNLHGVMGAGIAVQFRVRWPQMYAQYRDECHSGRLTLGGVFPWRDERTGTVVYNLATQPRPGRYATLDAVRSAVAVMVTHAERVGIQSVALPQIGCGLGGLAWADVRAAIDDAAGPSPVQVLAVTMPPRSLRR